MASVIPPGENFPYWLKRGFAATRGPAMGPRAAGGAGAPSSRTPPHPAADKQRRPPAGTRGRHKSTLPYKRLIRDSMTGVATESPRLRDIPILALLLVPTGLILTLVDWLFHFLPEPLDVAVSGLSIAGCLYWAWWFQRRHEPHRSGGRHRSSSSSGD